MTSLRTYFSKPAKDLEPEIEKYKKTLKEAAKFEEGLTNLNENFDKAIKLLKTGCMAQADISFGLGDVLDCCCFPEGKHFSARRESALLAEALGFTVIAPSDNLRSSNIASENAIFIPAREVQLFAARFSQPDEKALHKEVLAFAEERVKANNEKYEPEAKKFANRIMNHTIDFSNSAEITKDPRAEEPKRGRW